VDYGSDLPQRARQSAPDFDEVSADLQPVVFVVATPGSSSGVHSRLVEQIVRPAGQSSTRRSEVRDTRNQIDDLMERGVSPASTATSACS